MSRTAMWMPFYVGSYTADTLHLSTLEHGAYLLLLLHYWISGPLPNDDAHLAKIAKTSGHIWKNISPQIRKFFSVGEDGMLHQKRADIERNKSKEISEKRSKAAKSTRDKTPSEPVAKSKANAGLLPPQMPTHARASLPLPGKKEPEAIASGAESAVKIRPIRQELWDEGLDLLESLTGKHNGGARALLGKMLKAAKDDCAIVMSVLRECPETRDPVAWLTAAVQQRTRSSTEPTNYWAKMQARNGLGEENDDQFRREVAD